jgi:hypothetical protein
MPVGRPIIGEGESEVPTWAEEGGAMQPHAPVEVRSSYEGRWSGGFEVVAETPSGIIVRRLSDGSTLPEEVAMDDVRVVGH